MLVAMRRTVSSGFVPERRTRAMRAEISGVVFGSTLGRTIRRCLLFTRVQIWRYTSSQCGESFDRSATRRPEMVQVAC